MDSANEQSCPEDGRDHRMALGIALGTPFGVALSLILDNWGMLGVGIALGVAFGAMPTPTDRSAPDESDPREHG